MRKVVEIMVYAKRNIEISLSEHTFRLPAGNHVWIKEPTDGFVRKSLIFSLQGFVHLEFIYRNKPRVKVNWQKEGF